MAAIERAVIRFVRGEVDAHDGRFVPTSAELSREISKCFVAIQPAPKPVAWIPSPRRQEPDADSKARVRAHLEKLKQRMAQSRMETAE